MDRKIAEAGHAFCLACVFPDPERMPHLAGRATVTAARRLAAWLAARRLKALAAGQLKADGLGHGQGNIGADGPIPLPRTVSDLWGGLDKKSPGKELLRQAHVCSGNG